MSYYTDDFIFSIDMLQFKSAVIPNKTYWLLSSLFYVHAGLYRLCFKLYSNNVKYENMCI